MTVRGLKVTSNVSLMSSFAVFGHTPLGIYRSHKHGARYSENIMMNLKVELHKLTEKWRSTGQKARLASVEIPNLLARGHMHGMSDGFDVAADDVDTLLDKPDPPIDASEDSD
jgi:hypothetical protein